MSSIKQKYIWIISLSFLFILSGCSNSANPEADSDLVSAITLGSLTGAERAISKGANVNSWDSDGITPLSHAIDGVVGGYSDIDIVELLIEEGAVVNSGSIYFDEITPLMQVTHYIKYKKHGNVEKLKYFIKIAIKETTDVIPLLKKVLPDINFEEHRRFEELKEIVEILIEAEAGVDIKSTKYGKTALMMASNPDIAQLLIDAGADVNETDHDVRTALMMASNPDIAQLLIDNGADINATDKDGNTALILNAGTNNSTTGDSNISEIFKLLIANGADLNLKNTKGHDAMFFAKQANNQDQIKMLLYNGYGSLDGVSPREKDEQNEKQKLHNDRMKLAKSFGLILFLIAVLIGIYKSLITFYRSSQIKKRNSQILGMTKAKDRVNAQIKQLKSLNCQMLPEQNNQKDLLMTQASTHKKNLDGFNGNEENFIENDFIKEADALDLKMIALENEIASINKEMAIIEPQIKIMSEFLSKSKKSVTDWAKELSVYSDFEGLESFQSDLVSLSSEVNRLFQIIENSDNYSDMKKFIAKNGKKVEALHVQMDVYSLNWKQLKAEFDKEIAVVEPQIKTMSDFLTKSKKSVTDWDKEILTYSSIGDFDPYSKDIKPILNEVNRLLKIIKTIKTCTDMKNFIEKYSEEVESLHVQVDTYSISMKKLKAGISKESNGFKLKCPNPECKILIGKLQDGSCPFCSFDNVIETYRLS
ncbi:MAG: ankyrin repeat domain-containing protein [Agitococcus sp.]|nr:ankyrin repeat domain-containing protein [Agitococcus sp.]